MTNLNQRIGINGIAFSLGENIVTNTDLQAENPSWEMGKVLERTGVYSRPVAAPETTALDLGFRAAVEILEKLDLKVDEIDALIFCTQTPDYVLPPNSTLLHGRLNMLSNVMAFDISHACSGFMYGLGIAKSLVASGAANKVLLVTADTYSRLIHPGDRSIRPLFGDGAAATVISRGNPELTVLDMSFNTAGKQADRFIIKSGGCRQPRLHGRDLVELDKSGRVDSPDHIHMDGLGVLSFFNNVVPAAVREILSKNSKTLDDISLFVFHQASRLALQGITKSLGIPKDRFVEDMEDTGNLVSSSVPVALARAIAQQRLSDGDLVLLCGFGVGLSWSTALVEF